MSKIDIKPEQQNYKSLSRFKFFALTNFPFIDADFDALTSYEILCKIVEYLNGVIENEQVVTANVQSLYNAFISLQSAINDELEAQDQKIDDYFTNTNLQTFVDNKIDDMIESGDFQEIVKDAIEELGIGDSSKTFNVLNFGAKLQYDGLLDSFRDDVFLDSYDYGNGSNKDKVIEILNTMRKNNAHDYYFINTKDDESAIRLYNIHYEFESYNYYYVRIYYLLNYYDLTNPTVRWDTQFYVTVVDNEVTDTGFSGSYSSRTLYTGSSGGGDSEAPYTIIELVNGYYANDVTLDFNSDLQLIGEKLEEHYQKYGNGGYITFKNPVITNQWYSEKATTFEFLGKESGLQRYKIGKLLDGRPQALYLSNNDVLWYNFWYTTDDPVTIDYYSTEETIPKCLTLTNNPYYVPTSSYDPATKDYVDTQIAQAGGSSTEVTSSFGTRNGFINTGTNPVRLFKNGDTYQLRGAIACPTITGTTVFVGTISTDYAPLEMGTHGRIQLTGTCERITANDGNQTLWYQLVEYGEWDVDHYNWELRIIVESPTGGFDSSDYLYLNISWIRYVEPV